MPIENLVVVVSGANPQTKTLQVNVNPTTGAGTATLTLSGANAGTDSIKATATIAGTAYTSNTAEIGWQGTNGTIAVGNVVTNFWPSVNGSNGAFGQYHPMPGASATSSAGNSLLFNASSGIGADPSTQPLNWAVISSSGVITNYVTPWGGATAGYDMTVTGSYVVAQAGTLNVTVYHDDGMIWGVGGGATRVSGNGLTDGWNHTTTALNALPLIGGNNNSGFWTESFGVNFPAPGIYPFEFDFSNWENEQTLQILYNGQAMRPVQIGVAPTAPAGTGNLTITPAAQGLFVTGTTATITINVSGIVYSTKPYAPLYEGVSGSLALCNSGSSFVFPTYNGRSVSLAAASTAVVNLSGDNNSYQGLISVNASTSAFGIAYNGGALPTNVPYTTLTITVDDVAWYNGTNESFDVFAPSSNGGSVGYEIEFDYMVKPVVASLSPLSIPANGGTYTLVANLLKPISPAQQGINNTGNIFSGVFGVQSPGNLTAVTPILNSSGWITGYNLTVIAPVSSSTVTVTTACAFNDNNATLTYLSGTAFVKGNPYPGTVGLSNITFVGQNYTPPVNYSFSVTPTTGNAPTYTITGIIALTAQVYTTTNDPVTLGFSREQTGTTSVVNLGSAIKGATSSGTVNGKTVYFTDFSLSVNTADFSSSNQLGYIATDTTSGLTLTYWGSSTYLLSSGGGVGCPSLDMFVSESTQVRDVEVGYELTCLAQVPGQYVKLDSIPDSEKESHPVEWTRVSEEICYHFITENGAEVTVSDSTPIPVRELLELALDNQDTTQSAFPPNISVGMHLLTDVGVGICWSPLVSVECVGTKPVARLYCGGRNYAAGKEAGKYIYTHNLVPIPPPIPPGGGGGGGK